MRKSGFVFMIVLALLTALNSPATPAWTRTGSASTQSQHPASGHWEGNIDVQGTIMEISVDLARGDNGAWKGIIAIPSQSLKDYPLSSVNVEGSAISFKMASVQGLPTFSGKLSADGKTIAGDLSQAGMTFPFKLERKGDAKFGAAEVKAASIQVDSDIAGNWGGSLNAGGTVLRLIVKIVKAADGSFTASLDSPDQAQSDMPINSLTAAGDSVSFEMKYIDASFRGKLNKDRTELSGEWSQGGGSAPLTLKREVKK